MKTSKDQMSKKASDQKNKHDSKHVDEQVDYKDKYLRSLAYYQNLIKRTQQEKEEFYKYAHESFVEKLLPVLEHLNRANQNVEDHGVALIYKELRRVLEELGLKKIQLAENDTFNPEYMECIEAEPEGIKLVETRAGYTFKDKVILPVQVKVVK